MVDIRSESKFFFTLVKDLLFSPFVFVLFLFKKRSFSDLFRPFKDFWVFFWEAKFTASIILLNVFFYFVIIFVSVSKSSEAFDLFAKSYLLDGPLNLVSFNFVPFFLNWFVHFDFFHLFGNCLMLFILGRVVEKNFGFSKSAFIYFGSAFISGLLDNLVHFSDLGYFANGASGAIAGFASAAMLVNPFYISFLIGFPLPIFLVAWFQLYSDVLGVFSPSNVASWAHLGGFFAIIPLAFLLSSEDKKKLFKGLVVNIVSLIIGIVLYFFV